MECLRYEWPCCTEYSRAEFERLHFYKKSKLPILEMYFPYKKVVATQVKNSVSQFRNITYSYRPGRVAQLVEHWASISKVVGSVPAMAKHIFQLARSGYKPRGRKHYNGSITVTDRNLFLILFKRCQSYSKMLGYSKLTNLIRPSLLKTPLADSSAITIRPSLEGATFIPSPLDFFSWYSIMNGNSSERYPTTILANIEEFEP